MSIFLGCIADDFTGATDLANELQQQGLNTVLLLGDEFADVDGSNTEALVVAMKIRTAPVKQAVSQALRALAYLNHINCELIYFKYCSTFDSSAKGNIGPIADALLDALDEPFTIASPAFPRTGRTVYKGHLFVGDALLSETHMKNHPLTPMTDSNLVRVLSRQTKGTVGLIPYEIIHQGHDEIAAAFQSAIEHNHRYAIVDAVQDGDVVEIGRAVLSTEMKLVTGASGVAYGLAKAHKQSAPSEPNQPHQTLAIGGKCAVIAGSCSKASLGQIEHMKQTRPSFCINVLDIANGSDVAGKAIEWANQHLDSGPVLFYSSAPPDQLKDIQSTLGVDKAGELAEQTSSHIAKVLVDLGVRRLIVAGGETAGAVVQALGVNALRIGPEIDPGVPWAIPINQPPMALALKSGNFGSEDFFLKAFDMTS